MGEVLVVCDECGKEIAYNLNMALTGDGRGMLCMACEIERDLEAKDNVKRRPTRFRAIRGGKYED